MEDVSKLDPEKKNCVICLEDFKNKDKAIILPCIHLFHKTCIYHCDRIFYDYCML
ncbi:MAG: hypothetical protein J6P37_01275 [Lachnospiraceae bacterium]|nr:hypothetical protein [Lachnospiraceae bacterium]